MVSLSSCVFPMRIFFVQGNLRRHVVSAVLKLKVIIGPDMERQHLVYSG